MKHWIGWYTSLEFWSHDKVGVTLGICIYIVLQLWVRDMV